MIQDHAIQALLIEEETEKFYSIEFKNKQTFVGKIQKRPHIPGASKCYSLENANGTVIIFSYDEIVRFEEV